MYRLSLSNILASAGMLALTLACVSLTGCTLGNSASAVSDQTATPAVSGRIMGGETPVAGSKVTLWETDPTNSGYGLNAKVLAGPVTSSTPGGNFTFTTGYTCDPGQFVYATSTGGDVTNGSSSPVINPNLVLIAAMGSCSSFATAAAQGKVEVVINELTTIAAAYALGSFITVNENGAAGTQTVYMGAPSKNNATTGACTGTGASMSCTAAGLAHGFANAANLVEATSLNGLSVALGSAYTTVPGNTLASVPQAEINALGNIISYCTTTAGGSGSSGAGNTSDGSNCGNLFSAARTAACVAANTAPCVPQDTLTAAIDISKSPSRNAANLFAYVAGSSAPFQPSLTALGSSGGNLAIAITYTGILSNLGSPEYLALDANDDVYVTTGDLQTPTQAAIAAMTSSGTPLWNTGYSTAFCVPKFIATDTVGNVWATNNASSTQCTGAPAYFLNGYSQTSGSINYNFGASTSSQNGTSATTSPISSTSQPNGVAVDQYNNLWMTRGTSTGGLQELVYSGGATSGGTYGNQIFQVPGVSGGPPAELGTILLDGNQNVWFSTFGTSSTSAPVDLLVLPNNNAATPSTAPAYTANNYFYFNDGLSGGYSYGFGLDSTNSAWAGLNTQWIKLTAPTTNSVITGNPTATGSTTTFTAETKPYQAQFDGAGELWYTYYSSSGEIYYVWNPLGTSTTGGIAQSNKGIVPCYLPAGASTCSSTVVLYDPRSLQIDSTGSVWITGLGSNTSGTGNGTVVQLVGAAAPVWPQLSYAHFGAEPQ